MSYYDPNKDSYYDPSSNVDVNNSENNLGNAAKTMAAVMGLNLLGNVASRYLGGAAKGTLKKWIRTNGTKRSIAKRLNVARRTFSHEKRSLKSFLKETSYGKEYVSRKRTLHSMKGKPGYGAARITTAFKNPKTFLSTTAGVWKRNVLEGMGVAFAVDSALGITADLGLKKKEWYDIPGHAGNFGKWLAADSIAGLAMGAAAPVAKAMGSSGLQAAKKAFGGAIGRNQLDMLAKHAPGLPTDKKYNEFYSKEVLGNLRSQQERKLASDNISKALHFSRTVREKARHVQQALGTVPDAIREGFSTPGVFSKRLSRSVGPLKAALKQARDIGSRPKSQLNSTNRYGGLKALRAITELSHDSAMHRGKKISISDQDLNKFIPGLKKQADRETPLKKTFGFLKSIRNRDIVDEDWVSRTLGNLKNRYQPQVAKTLMDNVLNMKVGQNIFRDWRGTKSSAAVDLTAFDPVLRMRRMASAVLNKRWNVPLTKLSFSLGDLIESSKYLEETPEFELHRGKWNIPIDDEYGNTISLGELTSSKSLTMYANGRYATFDGSSVRTIDQNRKLQFAYRSSRTRKMQDREININRWKLIAEAAGEGDPEKAKAYYNKIKDTIHQKNKYTNQPWLNFFHNKGIGSPGILKRVLHGIQLKQEGNSTYRKTFSHIFEDRTDTLFNDIKHSPELVGNLYNNTSRVLSRISRGHKKLADFIHDKELRKDLIGIVSDETELLEKLNTVKADIPKDPLINRAVKEISAYPHIAKSHRSVEKLGPFSDMTSMDVSRVRVIDDIFHKEFITSSGSGRPHPMIEAASSLHKNGEITLREKKALQLHAKLSTFRYEGLTRSKFDNQYHSILEGIRRTAKENNWDITNEVIEYTKQNKIRSPNIDESFDKTLPSDITGTANVFSYIKNNSIYTTRPKTMIGAVKEEAQRIGDSVTDLLSEISPIQKRYIDHHGLGGSARYLAETIGLTAGAYFAYSTADTAIAANPLFEDTMFDQGLTGVAADTIAKGRLGMARVADITGVTGTMKYLHGLAPMSESSVPGALAGATAALIGSKSPLGVAKWTGAGALLNRMASPYLPDMTKSYEELREIYSGREKVPIMKAPTWPIGASPWEGSKVMGYSPNWYVRAKTRWKESDTMYGSALRRWMHEPLPLLGFNIGDIVDPYFMERKHFFNRPAPRTGGLFDEIPLIGKTIDATVGRIIKPEKTMHQEFLQADRIGKGETYPFAQRPPTLGEGWGMMTTPSKVRNSTGITMNKGHVIVPNSKKYTETAAEDFLYDLENFAGFKGFLGGSTASRIFGQDTVMPTLETAGQISSMSRSYYSLNLGGMGFMCLPPTEKVLTKNGLINIKDIKIGDKIIDNNYNYKKIINTNIRKCKKDEKLYEIENYAGKTKIKATETHPFAIIKKEEIKKLIKNPHRCKKTYDELLKNDLNWSWLPAKYIKINDFMVTPLPKIKIIGKIDLSDFHYGSYTDNYLYYWAKNESPIIIEELEKNTNITKIRNKFHNKKLVSKLLRRSKTTKIQKGRTERYINFDNDFAYFMGWWLAEGSANIKTGKIQFSLNINEHDIAIKLGKIYKRKTNNNYHIYINKKQNLCSLHLRHRALAIYLSKYGNVYTKNLANLIHLNDGLAISLLDGLINGDGFINHNKKLAGFASASPKLVRDVWLLLYRLGVNSSIIIDYKHISKITNKYHKISSLSFSKNSFIRLTKLLNNKKSLGTVYSHHTFTTPNYLYIKIRNIDSRDYTGKNVYDITVEESHCFVGNYALLHNSEPIRRLIDKPQYRRYGVNPIPNQMPNYLPEKYLFGDPYCVDPNALIESDEINFIKAKDITKSNTIITHRGIITKPESIKKRLVKYGEKVYKLKVQSLSACECSYSENHPIYVYENGVFKWKKIKYITKFDKICYPIPKRKFDKTNYLDLSKFLDYKFTDNFIYTDNRFNWETIYAIEYIEGIRNEYNGSNQTLNKWKYKLSNNYNIRRIKRYIKLDHDIMYFLGLWVAEGWINNTSVFMAHNIKEKNYSERANIGAQKLINCKYTFNKIENTNGARSRWNSYVLCNLLKNLFNKGAHNKKIPNTFWYLKDNLLYSFIKGYFDGDGNYCILRSYNYKSNVISFGSCNKILLLQFRKILLSFGEIFNLNYSNKHKKKCCINGKFFVSGINYKLTSSTCSKKLYNKLGIQPKFVTCKSRSKIIDNYLIMNVISNKTTKDISEVYGFQVDKDNSFCTAGVATHNTKIVRGELRLPGDAYNKTTTDLDRTMPGRACFIPETLIDTYDGLKPIIEAKNTLTNDGSYQNITKLHEKDYEGEILKISTDKISDKYNINVTPNHDIFAIKTNKCRYHKDQSKYRRACFNCKDKRKNICNKKQIYDDKYPIKEYKANELQVGDYLISPVISITNRLKEINLIKLLGNKYSYTVKDNKLYNGNNIQLPNTLILSKDLFKFIGFYLAEGSVSDYQVTFTFNSNEIEFHNFISNFAKKYFNASFKINFNKINKSATVVINSKFVRDILLELCGKTKEKFLFKEIYKCGYDNILGLLEGYISGDGHFGNNELSCTSCIENLSFSIYKLLCSIGYNPTFSYKYSKWSFFKMENRYIKSTHSFDTILYSESAKYLATKLGFIDSDINLDKCIYNGFIPYKIKNIEKYNYKGKVYDLTVENNHNYCVPFMLVHNSMLGEGVESAVQYFTGTQPPFSKESSDIMGKGSAMHEHAQQMLAAEGLLIQSEALVYDVKSDIYGHLDAIIRDGKGGKGKRALEIKTISDEGYQKLDGPKYEYVSQLNFYLKQTGMRNGSILYINRDNPSQTKIFDIQYSQSRWERDLKKINIARSIAEDMMEKGLDSPKGHSYSWVDRLRILSDVAPASKEFKEAKYIVEKQIKGGVLRQDKIEKYEKALKMRRARLRKYELYPKRFSGKIFNPDKVFNPDVELNLQSINEDIKAAAEYSIPERAVGAAWEKFTNTNNFLTNKFFAVKDPIEHYRNLQLYNKEYKPWDEPIDSFIKPYLTTTKSQTTPIGGAYHGGVGGFITGGGLGSIAGAAIGSIYGTAHGIYRNVTNSMYIPNEIKDKRDITSFFDAAKYAKADMLSKLSEGATRQKFLDAKNSTLTAYNRGEGKIADVFRGAGYPEKPYVSAFLNTTNREERNEILNTVPDDLGSALQKYWRKQEATESTSDYINNTSRDIAAGGINNKFDQRVMDPGTRLEDIQLKVVENEGYNAHDFGLGWNKQRLRMQYIDNEIQNYNKAKLSDLRTSDTENLDSSYIRGTINNLFQSQGINCRSNVYIHNHDNPNQVNITIKRDRTNELLNALDNREQWGL